MTFCSKQFSRNTVLAESWQSSSLQGANTKHSIARALQLAVVCALLLIGGNICAAQSTGSGTINGTVTDATGAVIEGAKVTAKLVATGISRSTKTNSAGLYVLPALRAGTYEIS